MQELRNFDQCFNVKLSQYMYSEHARSIQIELAPVQSQYTIAKVVVTYVKTSGPHCAMAVKSLGEKSLAGLTAKPELNPNEAPITIRSKPMAIGFSPTLSRGLEFFESVMAKIPSKRRNVPITYGRSITIIIMRIPIGFH